MLYVFNKSCVGYSHIKNDKPCQDYSSSYRDNERVIISCCDGHGGRVYKRSKEGAKFASLAVLNVFMNIAPSFFRQGNDDELKDKIKLSILCEYNKLVERDLVKNPIRKHELSDLDEEEIESLHLNPAKAYGTTLSGALLIKNKLLVVSIGDTEALGINKGEIVKLFDNSDDPAGNITYSMCQEDAYRYLRVAILDFKSVDGLMLCTDGLSSPYVSYSNLNQSLVKPMVRRIINTKTMKHINEYVENIAATLGVGDDVSLSFILKDDIREKYYR